MLCAGNCSGAGACVNGACNCDVGFTFSDCSGFVPVAARQAFPVVRWLSVSLSLLLASFVAVRLASVITIKRASGCRLLLDAQLQTVSLILANLLCMGGQWLLYTDVYAYLEYQNSSQRANLLLQIAFAFGILAVARTTHFFGSVFARFHPPTKRVCVVFAAISILFCAAFIITVCVGIATTLDASVGSSYSTDNIGFAIYSINTSFCLVILLGLFVYALAVLREPSDAAVLRAQSANERESRRQLLAVVRAIMVAVAVMLVVSGAFNLSPRTPANLLAYYHTILGLDFACAVLLATVMGRTRKSDQTAPTPT